VIGGVERLRETYTWTGMGFVRQGGSDRGYGWLSAAALAGFCLVGVASAAVRKPMALSPWDAAVAARERFEAEPARTHTKVEFTEVMDRFRAIYHADPSDAHAARAVEQVAELLVEQGTELKDKKSLRDGAAQYAFLAKAYPAYAWAEKRRLAEAKLGGDVVGAPRAAAPARGVASAPASLSTASAQNADSGREDKVVGESAESDAATKRRFPAGMTNKKAADGEATAVVEPTVAAASASGMAVVTGIRHWSTSTYTRVAIDLAVEGDEEVKYEAARVEGPDRLFFDLHHAKLTPGLVGKSFSITDDGFLTKIRAAPAGGDVTRVVLDVKQVGEYSAFLLPNPLRLIIDIHGKTGNREDGGEAGGSVRGGGAAGVSAAPSQKREGSGRDDRAAEGQSSGVGRESRAAGEAKESAEDARSGVANPEAESEAGASQPVETAAVVAAPVVRARASAGSGEGGSSSLPPMPVTDGSAGFGLPAKNVASHAGGLVAQPRVVISSKPTVAKPVPNTVTKSSATTGREVAAVSLQPGKVEATTRPTSGPVSSGGASGSGVSGDHYVPRSRRAAVPAAAQSRESEQPGIGGEGSSTTQKRDTGHATGEVIPSATAAHVSGAPVVAAGPTADGQTSLVRALGLKIGRIVIDAGHGGHDSGTLGAGGIEEKDVVLDVALRLGKLLHDRLGAEIVYTRADDTFIPLETRTAIANKAQADLFISVHANSSPEPSARGVEVYYLNFTSDPEAMTVASRENAVSTQSVHELSDLVKKIALKDKIEESKELAADVDASLYAGLAKGNEGLKDRGVKKAPFVVLIGANMPSILAEISFVTNPEDAEQLETPEYRERVAESLYGGVAKYAEGINGFPAKKKVKMERAAR
jgi:N-acetylmuramoyl-L-alanine amidase